jgi:hypothetical protein
MPKNGHRMRTQGFRTHVLLALAGAVLVLVSLGRPWYARAPLPVSAHDVAIGDVNGPLNGLLQGAQRWVGDPYGVTGWHALGTLGSVLAALVGIAILGLAGSTIASTQSLAREPLRYAAFAVLAVALWKLVDPPGSNAAWELRSGALVDAVGAAMLAVCAHGVAGAPLRRRVPTPRYVPPLPPA